MNANPLMNWMIATQKWLYGGMTGGLKAASGVPDFAAMMFAAFLFGSVHALMPGHGKSVLVSYHLGHPSRLLQGAASAALLAFTHVGLAALLVLGGVKIISVSLAAGGRAPAIESISAAFVFLIGVVLFVRALRPHRHEHSNGSGMLAFAAGLIPCPLTTFMLTYAIANDRLTTGLAAVSAMLAGITLTLAAFAILAIVFRERLAPALERSGHMTARAAFWAEVLSAAFIMIIGAWTLFNAAARI